MSFTDDRLRILKNIELKQTSAIQISHTDMEALIVRLEAAEKVCLQADCVRDQRDAVGWKKVPDEFIRWLDEAFLAWRKACGK